MSKTQQESAAYLKAVDDLNYDRQNTFTPIPEALPDGKALSAKQLAGKLSRVKNMKVSAGSEFNHSPVLDVITGPDGGIVLVTE